MINSGVIYLKFEKNDCGQKEWFTKHCCMYLGKTRYEILIRKSDTLIPLEFCNLVLQGAFSTYM